MNNTPFQTFEHKDFGVLHTYKTDDDYWFLAKDIAREFGILNVYRMLDTYIRKECVTRNIEYESIKYGPLVNLEGVHHLAELNLASANPEFAKWIDEKVVPEMKPIDKVPWYDREIYFSEEHKLFTEVLGEAMTFSAGVVLGTHLLFCLI